MGMDGKVLKSRYACLSLGLVAILVFVGTLGGDFLYDDYNIIVNNPQIRSWDILHIWKLPERPVRIVSLMLDYHLFGLDPRGYHLQNIFWHISSVLLLYALFFKLSGDALLSFFGAFLFALHPIHVEAVANIANRKEPICMFFSLLSFLLYMKFMEKRRWLWLFISLLAFYLALYSKEVAFVLPILFLAYEYIFIPAENRFLSKRLLPLLIGLVLAAALFAALMLRHKHFDFINVGSTLSFAGYRGDASLFSVIYSSPKAFWNYVQLLLFPFNLSPGHIMDLSSNVADPLVIVSWLAIVCCLWLSIYLIPRRPLISFALLWFFIHYLPISNLLPSTYLVAERYMYIPSAGFCLLLAAIAKNGVKTFALRRGSSFATSSALIVLVIGGFYSIQTISYSYIWSDRLRFWNYALKVNPDSSKYYNNRGMAYNDKGKYKEAIEDFSRSIERSPLKGITYSNRGNAYLYLGRYEEAIKDYEKSIKLDPTYAEASYNLGIAYQSIGDYQQALHNFNQTISLKPGFNKVYNNRGNTYNQIGNYKKAIEDYSMAIKLDMRYEKAYFNRAVTYYRIGELRKAASDHNSVIELNPQNAKAYYYLGLEYSGMGDANKAQRYYEKAATLGLKEARKMLIGVAPDK